MENFTRTSAQNFYRTASAIIEVYDVTDNESFLYVRHDAENIERLNYAPGSRFVLVGNKVDKDLTDDSVSEDFARSFIANYRTVKFDDFVLTSAKTGQGVADLLTRIASILISSNPVTLQPEKSILLRKYDKRKRRTRCIYCDIQ